MTRILGVHGVGNYRPGETAQQASDNLAAAWRNALGDTPEPAGTHGDRTRDGGPDDRRDHNLAVAYYAHLLRPPTPHQGGPTGLDGLDALEQRMVRDWLAELLPRGGVPAGPGTWPLRQAVSWLARTRFPGRAGVEWFVATFFREVATYLREEGGPVRGAVRGEVAAAIAAHRPEVVVAHSLGSVVAYEALWAYPETPVELLVTVGSPLALPHAVFPRLDPAPLGARGKRPPGVRRWVNLADPGDIVAVPPRGVGHRFDGVAVDEHTVIHAFDFHRVRNYLRAPRVREAVLDLPRG
ncbi:serine peptidase [Streptomyces sp. NPDC006923]|uniref:serine peptidase n=1 Tax=Streptomyces sp. NPDC006923 TaxID=3155355 RepID=UPI0033DE9843